MYTWFMDISYGWARYYFCAVLQEDNIPWNSSAFRRKLSRLVSKGRFWVLFPYLVILPMTWIGAALIENMVNLLIE